MVRLVASLLARRFAHAARRVRLALTLKKREPVCGAEAIAERPNGERVPFLAEPTLLFDADGALAGVVNL